MKKILAVIMLIMSLFMKPLFAPEGTEKVLTPKEKKTVALVDIHVEQYEILKEKQRKLREQEAKKKVQQEEEARKQKELQKKIDELKAQEEKAEQEKVAVEKKTKEDQEAAKRKKLAEDPRKQIADALGDLFAANKKYAAADVETDDKKKADYIKSGDALFKKFEQELYDALSVFSFGEVEKIISTMELSPARQFMILQNLIEVYVDHAKVIDAAHVKVFFDVIDALFYTIRPDELQKFIMTEAGPKALHEVQVMMLPILGEGRILKIMFDLGRKLVELSNKAPIDQREHMSAVVLDWLRNVPVEQSSSDLLANIFSNLKAESIVADVSGLRDWLLTLEESQEEDLLKTLGQKYLKAVYEDGHFGTLRDALPVFRKVLGGIFPPAEEARLKIAFLKKASQGDVFQAMSNNDRSMVLKYLAEYIADQGSEALVLWTVMANNLDAVIEALQGERAKAIGTKRFADLGEQLKQLQTMEEQLAEMYSPSWLEKLSTAGKLAWQKVVTAWKGQEKSFVPNFESWNAKEIGKAFFNITDKNYKNYEFTSVDELIKSLSTLRDAINWYADFPEVQAFLKKWARNFYDANKTFASNASYVQQTLDLQKIINFLISSRDMQDIFFSDYIHEPAHGAGDYVSRIARGLVRQLTDSASIYFWRDINNIKNISKFAIERFITGRNTDFVPYDYAFTFERGRSIGYEFLDSLNNDAFAAFIKLFPEWELKCRRYKASRPVNEDASFNEERGVWYAKLLDFTKKIDPRRALALLDAFETLNTGLKAENISGGFNDYSLKAARAEIEERLKAQQESEAKTKASAVTSASTSSVSSGIASTTSTSSSSANVTTSSSMASTSSGTALTRGIGALTQSRS
jgi:hypothetical protein